MKKLCREMGIWDYVGLESKCSEALYDLIELYVECSITVQYILPSYLGTERTY